MKQATLIYPHQLFHSVDKELISSTFYLIEDPLFFTQYKFHKKKIAFHRASMKAFEAQLKKKKVRTCYVDSAKITKSKDIATILQKNKIKKVNYFEFDDYLLEKRVSKSLKKYGIESKIYKSPLFLTDISWSKDFVNKKKSYFQTSYYIAQRKRLNILIEDDKPTGGSWTFDKENRKKLPKNITIPKINWPKEDKFYKEAVEYTQKNFSQNFGQLDGVIYPYSRKQAKKALREFIENRLHSYGDYQDAIHQDECFMFHSLLSAPLSAGIITPKEVIQEVLKYHNQNNLPLNSLEGFIRQIIGWREYFRIIYNLESVKQRTENYFDYKRKIPTSFYNGTTGIEPIDNTINKVLKNAYAHHIERLMVLGNFMLLCEFDPDEVYRWFMELFIDAYDWVMVPNVYGMSQYADGGLITTKPYVSSSNYIKKMSNFKSGKWTETWDALYWHFIHKNQKSFKTNPRMTLMIRQLDKMDKDKLKNHLKTAKAYLKSLDE